MILKRQKHDLSETDFTNLDKAVSELTKQTEALLGNKKSITKKSLKKATSQKSKTTKRIGGHSFDIVQPAIASKIPASLKSSPRKKIKLNIAGPQIVKLPEHAGYSYNEEPQSITPVESVETTVQRSSNAQVVGHRPGSLKLTGSSEADKEPDHDDNEPAIFKSDPSPASQSFTFVESSPNEEVQEATPPDSSSSDEESINNNSIAGKMPNETGASPQTTEQEPLKEGTPRSYKPHVNQQKPTVFDTNEYHVELHDWSSLSRSSRAPFIIFLILSLALISAAVYFVFWNQA